VRASYDTNQDLVISCISAIVVANQPSAIESVFGDDTIAYAGAMFFVWKLRQRSPSLDLISAALANWCSVFHG
jgi:hypothetical protein